MHVTGRSRMALRPQVGPRGVVLREDSTERLSTFRYVYVGSRFPNNLNITHIHI